ncbi:6-phosphogluconolactonase [Humidisolicoccus flavus]|uniref:6-phosphogluconolactonase n=1 Tax=Humidisolicoccus flavus TaxID=3111414 RepID=UPI003243926B
MTNENRVLLHTDRDALCASVAARFITKVIDLLDEQERVDLCLAGGTVGIQTLGAIAANPASRGIAWDRVHCWWGDERWLPEGDPERNVTQARDAILDGLEIPTENIHAFAASDEGLSLDEAASRYAEDVAELDEARSFDIAFLGVGPDGHIASLFPGHSSVAATELVIAERDSPKPPSERLSLTLPVINRADRIWVVLSGGDKAPALGLALAGAPADEVPLSGVRGQKRTVFFVDQSAAAEVPANLIATGYDQP